MSPDTAAAPDSAPESPTEAVDWAAGARRARQLARPGPDLPAPELEEFVAELRQSARSAPSHVGAVTGLLEPALEAGAGPVYVVDRPRWAQANLTMLRSLVGDVLPQPGTRWGARTTGTEIGTVLALLSSRVLGQYDPYTTTSDGTGRLVLVAPTILTIQREMNVKRADFGLWVCLHEQTHALQFAAAPWLADHMRATMRRLMGSLGETDTGAERVQQLARALPKALRGEGADTPAGALTDAVLSPAERELFDESMAMMSLLEGHADVVMDEVGPQVLPTVATIRRKFERRRSGASRFDVLLRRLLGLDAKLAQYRNGAAFVRGVVDDVGHEGFNAVWAAPENLPSAAEVADPAAWVHRVHG